ncbi:MAG: 23S rRNA (adenine(1618)-N(6))-methyltransferase RlmF [Mariniphaga sp.]
MLHKKREHPKEKIMLHPRNKHRGRYEFRQLSESTPELAPFVKLNSYDDESIDFSDPQAVRILNKALLKHLYGIDHWNIPSGYLCPPVPGRADYIHYIADLLTDSRNGNIPTGSSVKCLDIGTGSSCVYPLIGTSEYGWSFVGTDIDPVSLESANKIVALNPILDGKIELRLQKHSGDIFNGIIRPDEHFDLTICNPPFHSSAKDAQSGSLRKLKNLNSRKITNPVLNFGGQGNELWCEGGELRFVQNMIIQSKQFAASCLWFTTLLSKESNLKKVEEMLKKAEAVGIKIIPMGQGNKISRIVAWTFFTDAQ